MHGIYKLKDKIIEELEEFGTKGEFKASELPTIDTLAHAAKNLCKLIQMCEEETGYSYGDHYYRKNYDMGNSYRNYDRYDDGMSYARGRRRYDSGYSGNGDWMTEMLYELKEKSPNDQMKREFDEFIKRLERSSK